MDTFLSILPVAVLVATLAVFGLPAWSAALAAFAVAVAEAVFAFGLSPGAVVQCAAAGLAGRERAVMARALGYFAAVLFVACLSVVAWNALAVP